MMLSRYVSLAEASASDTAARLGIDNAPDQKALQGLTRLAQDLIDPVAEYYAKSGCRIQITSMYRCLALNRKVGSKDNSQHIASPDWAAVDFKIWKGPYQIPPLEVCSDIASHRIPVSPDQLIHEFASWSHMSWSKQPRSMLLTIDRLGSRPGLWPAR